MAIGVVILAHTQLHRTRQVARLLASQGCKIAIHVDANTDNGAYNALYKSLCKNPAITFTPRIRCDWGRFSLVKAGLDAASHLIARWPALTHVTQISGSCIPLKEVAVLEDFLAAHPDTDFVEAVPAANQDWVKGGLQNERFSLYFPFSWKKQRWAFDLAVSLQRKLGIKRTPPCDLVPHLGSQWWCLTQKTLFAILNDPDRATIDRYFRACWIPDESYVPTMVQRHATKISARPLTLARFDEQGKPHVFYDDHLAALAASDYFFARKIWHGAGRLYRVFCGKNKTNVDMSDQIDTLETRLDAAFARRTKGRDGRLNVGRFPKRAHHSQPATSCPYSVFMGMTHICDGFENWLTRTTGHRTHGRVFKFNEVEFAKGAGLDEGAVPANPKIRDLNPEQFLCNMMWNGRQTPSALIYDIADDQRMAQFFANDKNAAIYVLRGGWVLDLLSRNFDDEARLLREAQRLFNNEQAFVAALAKADHKNVVWITLGDMISEFATTCKMMQDALTPGVDLRPRGLPGYRDLSGLRALIGLLERNDIDPSSLGVLPDALPGEENWRPATRVTAVS